jgi:short-subunit dehydrogenase
MRNDERKLAKAYGGKTFIITGAARGLGAAIARQLAPHWGGALLLDINEKGLEEIGGELSARSPNVLTRTVDLTNAESIAAAFSDLPPEFDPPDVLVNNAGITFMRLAEKQPLDEYRKMMDVNYFAVIAAVNRFLPKMLERRSGRVLTIASGSGVLANYGGAGYCGSKFAIVGYMEVLRQELAGTGVKAQVVLLPTVMTDFHKALLEGEFADMTKGLPTITPDEAARRLLRQAAGGKEVISFGTSVEAGLLINRLAPGLLRAAMSLNGYILNRRRGRLG